MQTGLAAKVREAARARPGSFRVGDLVQVLDIRTYKEAARVTGVLRDFMRSGEVTRIDRGLYVYVNRPARRGYLDIIWHLVRSHRQFTTDDIERLSGAKRATVLEYLRCLKRYGFLRSRVRGRWELIEDPGPARPVDAKKCERLKGLRRTK